MTPIQYKIYQFIQNFIDKHGYAPLLKEIALGVGISPKSKSFISRTVHSLTEKGLLIMEGEGRPRNIKLVKDFSWSLPLVGRIAAGSPIEAIQQTETLDLAAALIADNHFVLEVRGDSMIEEGILDGDKVICKQQDTANEGDIVVALIDNYAATLKRILFKPQNNVTLLPANAKLSPEVYPKNRIRIQGVFVGLLRFPKRV
jgi:repressor LexA